MGEAIKSLDLTTKKIKKRSAFDAARVSRFTSGWNVFPQNTDTEIKNDLLALRARSRNLGWNNDYGKRFINLVKINTIGHTGIKLQVNSKYPNGDTDDTANNIIEDAFRKWSMKGVCTANKKQSLLSFKTLCMASLPTDGEILIRHITGWKGNDFGYAVHLYDPDYLDVNLNETLANGNQIRMGVEVDKWGAPVNYHFLTNHPYDWQYNRYDSPKKYDVVPAHQISHFYIHERINQTRGVPWMATPAERLYQLGGYEEAELIAARGGASKTGFYEIPSEEYPDDDGEDSADAAPTQQLEPGVLEVLPKGWKFNPYDPDHPNAGFESFCMAILRGVSSGLNVSYVSLANDLRGVSFASIRQGTLADQDAWRMLQYLFIAEVLQDVFTNFLTMGLLSPKGINLPFSKFDKFNAPQWQPRGWEWVNPMQDVMANERAVKNGYKTPQQVVAAGGNDYFDNIKAIEKAKKATDNAGIKTPALHESESKFTVAPAKAAGGEDAD